MVSQTVLGAWIDAGGVSDVLVGPQGLDASRGHVARAWDDPLVDRLCPPAHANPLGLGFADLGAGPVDDAPGVSHGLPWADVLVSLPHLFVGADDIDRDGVWLAVLRPHRHAADLQRDGLRETQVLRDRHVCFVDDALVGLRPWVAPEDALNLGNRRRTILHPVAARRRSIMLSISKAGEAFRSNSRTA